MLYETRNVDEGNLVKSLRLADYVADDNYQFYEELRHTKKMGSFLALIRDSSRAILEITGDMIV